MNRAIILAAMAWTSCAVSSDAAANHDPEFWRDLRAKHFLVPPTQPMLPLALEATRLLGSPDPNLRDAVAFEALASWVYEHRRLNDQELGMVLSQLMDDARVGLGEAEGDGLYLRSFPSWFCRYSRPPISSNPSSISDGSIN